MIRITTNENNPLTLKLVVAANHSKKAIEINSNEKNVKQLPLIQIDDEIFFTSNAVLLNILPPSNDNKNSILEWLEWESTILTPIIAVGITTSFKEKKLKENFKSCLEKLEANLKGKKFIVGDKLSAADVAIWSILHPLPNEHLNDFTIISNWCKEFEKLAFVEESLKKYSVGKGESVYRVISSNYSLEFSEDTVANGDDERVTSEELALAEKAWTNGKKTVKDSSSKAPILPKPNQKNILITSALPYVNNIPHLGNIIGCVLSADVFARFSRLRNHNVLYICGTDEYGTATETKALEEGLTCREICDKYFKIHQSIYEWFDISFDQFGRTSTPEQTELCQDMFLQLNQNGFTFTENVDQLHCENCNRFLADRFVEGGCPNLGCNYEDARGDQCDGCGKLVNAIELKNPRCKVCGKTPKIKTSKQFFIDLPQLEPLLLHWFKKSSPGWSNNAQIITKTWLKEGLKPRCITRDLKWGIPVPLKEYSDKVFYVWFDAPIGYMSITKRYTSEWEKWWKPTSDVEVTLYNFMAKDNVPFHSIMFPATLLGCNRGYVTVSHLMATEYLNYEDGKFSKSRGVGVFGTDAQDTKIPSDVWRFYLLFLRPESQDSNFNWVDLATKNNSELLNNLGNFVNRALMFAKNSFNKIIPKMVLSKDDFNFLALCNRELKNYISCLKKAKLKDGLRYILAISKLGNQYMQSNQPWVLLKGTEEEKQRAGTIIGVSCNIACLLSIILSPFMPQTSENLRKQLNIEELLLTFDEGVTNLLPEGHKIGEPHPLFQKIEQSQIEALKAKFGAKQQKTTNNVKLDKSSIQKMVDDQAALVRKLKSETKDKTVWQPEVAKLLELKAKLQEAEKSESEIVKENPQDVEKEIAKQGLVVRKLKESGADRPQWQPEVDKLLALKKKLAAITGVKPTKGKK